MKSRDEIYGSVLAIVSPKQTRDPSSLSSVLQSYLSPERSGE
jgi:hypothetical protein